MLEAGRLKGLEGETNWRTEAKSEPREDSGRGQDAVGLREMIWARARKWG